jgi:hypothetical protein
MFALGAVDALDTFLGLGDFFGKTARGGRAAGLVFSQCISFLSVKLRFSFSSLFFKVSNQILFV